MDGRRFPAGGSGRWPRRKPATTRCPTIMGRSGRMTTRWSPWGWPATAMPMRRRGYSRDCSTRRPIRICAACRNCSAASRGGGRARRSRIRSPAHPKLGPVPPCRVCCGCHRAAFRPSAERDPLQPPHPASLPGGGRTARAEGRKLRSRCPAPPSRHRCRRDCPPAERTGQCGDGKLKAWGESPKRSEQPAVGGVGLGVVGEALVGDRGGIDVSRGVLQRMPLGQRRRKPSCAAVSPGGWKYRESSARCRIALAGGIGRNLGSPALGCRR